MFFFKKSDYEIGLFNDNGVEEYWVLVCGVKTLKIDSAAVDLIKSQISEWWVYLNTMLGLFLFTTAIAVQGTPNPPLNAFIALVFFGLFHYSQIDAYFPKSIATLRRKDDKKIYKAMKKYIDNEMLGIQKTLSKGGAFILSYFYFVLMVSLAFEYVQKLKIYGMSLGELFLPSNCPCLYR